MIGNQGMAYEWNGMLVSFASSLPSFPTLPPLVFLSHGAAWCRAEQQAMNLLLAGRTSIVEGYAILFPGTDRNSRKSYLCLWVDDISSLTHDHPLTLAHALLCVCAQPGAGWSGRQSTVRVHQSWGEERGSIVQSWWLGVHASCPASSSYCLQLLACIL